MVKRPSSAQGLVKSPLLTRENGALMTLTALIKQSKNFVMALAAGLVLVACGGGGGSGGGTTGGTTYDLDTLGVPKFIATNYLDVSAQVGGIQSISKISKFRSSVGHSYGDSQETCRSMKHYFMTPATTTDIVSPVAGKIRTIYEESQGTQIGITPDAQPAFEIRIFHVNKVKTFTVGEAVSAGQKLGTHYTTGTYSDVAVFVSTPSGIRAVSYFEALTDAAFQPYKDMGINAPSDLIITKAQRDAAPLTCSGETFTNAGSDTLPQWVNLDPAPVAAGAFAALADMTIGDNGGDPIVTPIQAGGVTDPLGRIITYTATGFPNIDDFGDPTVFAISQSGQITFQYDVLNVPWNANKYVGTVTVTASPTGSGKSISKSFQIFLINE